MNTNSNSVKGNLAEKPTTNEVKSTECDVSETPSNFLRPKRLRPRSYHIALRESIFINTENMGSYSYWNRTYSKLEKRNTYVGQDSQVFLENLKTDLNRLNSV